MSPGMSPSKEGETYCDAGVGLEKIILTYNSNKLSVLRGHENHSQLDQRGNGAAAVGTSPPPHDEMNTPGEAKNTSGFNFYNL